jgi:hypothetical protein
MMMTAIAHLGRPLGAGALALLLSACSMGNMFAPAPGGPAASAQYATANASQADIAAASSNALPAIATECPPIKVRAGGEAMFKYANNARPNPRELNYQAVIDKQSRNCVVSNGKITIRMGVVGRLLLGPAGNVDSAEIPIRFAVERDGTALFTEAYQVPVAVPAGSQSTEFVKVVENVEIPYLGGESITIWVGFDPRA